MTKFVSIVDPKLKDVTFEYLVNGERIVKERLTQSRISRVFGSAEYSVVGNVPENTEINKIQIIINGQTDSKPFKEVLILTPCLSDQQNSTPTNFIQPRKNKTLSDQPSSTPTNIIQPRRNKTPKV